MTETMPPANATESSESEVMTPKKQNLGVWVSVAIGVVVIVFGAVFASRFGRNPNLVASPLIGLQAPDIAMPYLETTGELSLKDLEGDIVVVNFWASWCTGCRIEHAGLLTAAAAFEDVGVSFVGILYQDRRPTGIRFLDELGRGSSYRYVVDDRSRTGIQFGVLGLPTTFFLNRAGTIVGQVNGPVSLDILVRTLDTILIDGSIAPITQTGELENR